MVAKETIANIKDEELRNLLSYLDSNYSIHNRPKLMPDNNSPEQILIKRELAKFFYRKLVSDELVSALNISDDYKYKRQIEVTRNLLFKDPNTDYYSILKGMFWIESSPSMYDELMWFIKSQNINFKDGFDTKLSSFVQDKKNKLVINNSKDVYSTLEYEQEKLREFINYQENNGPVPIDYLIFKNNVDRVYMSECNGDVEGYLQSKYKAQLIGHIGEYLVDKHLHSRGRDSELIAKTLGNGYGFDDFYILQSIEKLGEVKSTLTDSDDDSFVLTPNEFEVMCDCIDTQIRDYFVFRTFIDKDNLTTRKILVLDPISDKTLRPLNESYTTYVYRFNYEDDKGKHYVKTSK